MEQYTKKKGAQPMYFMLFHLSVLVCMLSD